MQYTKNFTELGKNDAHLAGGKGASLGEMTQAGIPVPGGYVVLADTFDIFLKETDLVQEIDAILDGVNHEAIHTVEKASEDIQSLILSRPMPEAIQKEIQEKFQALGSQYVAVRSSATAEDGADHAWAGQLDSFLNTTEGDLIEKVRRCWASLFTPRAIFYRFEKGLHTTHISVAVVVQSMVNSEKSGIAFSVHPVTEDYNQLIIEAGFGLGEAIVSGSVTPDSYVVEKSPRNIIDINVSHQSRALYRIEGGGSEWRELSESVGNSQVLTEIDIQELSDIIVRIENHYGFPCDIEWAYENKTFYIVQSRPITTLTPKNEINKKEDLIPLTKENTVFTFESTGTTFLFEDIVSHHYIQWECIRVAKADNVRVFVKKEEVARMNEEGAKMTRAFLEEKVALMQEASDYMDKYTDELKGKETLTREELQDFFQPLEVICDNYSFFDIHYSDGMVRGGEFSEAGGYVQETKNFLRDVLGKPFFQKDGWMRLGLEVLAKQFSVPEEALEWYTKKDIENLFEDKRVSDEILVSRKLASVLYRDKEGTQQVTMTGEDALKIFESFEEKDIDKEKVQGVVAHKGMGTIRGKVRLVKKDFSDPSFLLRVAEEFEEGSVLVTDTTDPDFLPIMKKSGAIVTDIGGMLSHASITSRELNKLCVVGTVSATKVFKDGDLVEVDADNGVVRKIENNSFKPEDYSRMFAGPSFAMLFSDIFLRSTYGQMGVISVQNSEQWMSFIPKTTQSETEKIGKTLYEEENQYIDYRDSFELYMSQAEGYFRSVLEKEDSITKELAKEFLVKASEHFNYYQKTEFFYTDKIDTGKMIPSVKEFDELKLKGRSFLNKLLFEDEGYLKSFVKKVSLQANVDAANVYMYSVDEFCELLEGNVLDEKILEDRKKGFIISGREIFAGEGIAENIEILFASYKHVTKEIQGTIASPGRVTGNARVLVSDFNDFDKVALEVAKMEEGEILIAETTSPEIILACKKAAAIVTNQGGMLSHAAIVSRELGIPCVIGTKADVLLNIKTGDRVEVDADNGLVRILNEE